MIKITARQAEVYTMMRAGLTRTGIARKLSLHHLTVWGHQKALEKHGLVTPGTNRGIRRRTLKDGRSFRVLPDRQIVTALNAARRRSAWLAAMNAHPEPGDARIATVKAARLQVDREIRRERRVA